MRYLMFIVHDPDHSAQDAADAPPIEGWFDYVREHGSYLQGIRLQGREEATTVRVRGGKLLVTDGPFAETKEWIGGVAVLECADLAEAIEIAKRNNMAHEGRIELRPIHSMGGPD
ncbi:MAG: YciI family protein [Ilumatobacteraceae bacterium]